MKIKLTFLALILMASTASIMQAAPTAVKVSSDPWEPWVIGEDGKEATKGIAVEITREIFRRLNIPVEIRIYPYERCLQQMKTGERDILLMVKKTPEREQFLLFTQAASEDPQMLYYNPEKKGSFEWNDWKDLEGTTVGIVRGFNYGDFTKSASNYKIKQEVVSADAQNLQKLLAGRIDFTIMNRSTARYYLETNPGHKGKLQAASRIISEAQFHIAISKKGAATGYLQQIDNVLTEMKKDPDWRRKMGFAE